MVTVEITGPIETDFNLFLEYDGDTKSPTTSKCHYIYVYYPAKNTYGTVMFEDRWPVVGDYDLNDLIIDCNWIEKYYAWQWILVPPHYWFRKVFGIEAKFKIRATGASYKISYAVQLPNICYIDGTVTTTLPQGLRSRAG